jgi:hypothetical protein
MTIQTRLWPTLDELVERRQACVDQIDARIQTLGKRWGAQNKPGAMISTADLADDDIVVKNLRARLETYDVDIVRMREHELTWLSSDVHADGRGKVWACRCTATGTAPTAYVAMSRYNEHVMDAVWGAGA